MYYPIVIHKDADSDYSVTVPDLPGCFSAGSSFEQALSMAAEAIECHAEGLLEAGESLPSPKSIKIYQKKSQYRGGVWAMVSVDLSKLLKKAKRININFPKDYYIKSMNMPPKQEKVVRAFLPKQLWSI